MWSELGGLVLGVGAVVVQGAISLYVRTDEDAATLFNEEFDKALTTTSKESVDKMLLVLAPRIITDNDCAEKGASFWILLREKLKFYVTPQFKDCNIQLVLEKGAQYATLDLSCFILNKAHHHLLAQSLASAGLLMSPGVQAGMFRIYAPQNADSTIIDTLVDRLVVGIKKYLGSVASGASAPPTSAKRTISDDLSPSKPTLPIALAVSASDNSGNGKNKKRRTDADKAL